MELEPRSTRMVLGRAGGGLTLFDLKLGKPVGTVRCLRAFRNRQWMMKSSRFAHISQPRLPTLLAAPD